MKAWLKTVINLFLVLCLIGGVWVVILGILDGVNLGVWEEYIFIASCFFVILFIVLLFLFNLSFLRGLSFFMKGGFFGIGVGIILFLISILSFAFSFTGDSFSTENFFVIFFAILFLGVWFEFVDIFRIDDASFVGPLGVFIIFIIVGFLIGALLGWIIGKIKSRNAPAPASSKSQTSVPRRPPEQS